VEVGLPGGQFVQQADSLAYTHHSNVDVFDHLQEEHLERNAWIMSYFAYMTANALEMLPRRMDQASLGR
jgi:hypothetical protein